MLEDVAFCVCIIVACFACWELPRTNMTVVNENELSLAVGRVMSQAVSRRPLTAEARVRAWFNPCWICGGQSGTGTGFSPSSSVFPCRYHSTVALQTHIIWGTRNMLT
jgi:hypothetical protein